MSNKWKCRAISAGYFRFRDDDGVKPFRVVIEFDEIPSLTSMDIWDGTKLWLSKDESEKPLTDYKSAENRA